MMKTAVVLSFTFGLVLWSAAARADFAQIKAYKAAYPDSRPKCIDCHVDRMPKKADGQHDPNDYGKAVIKAAGAQKPTADTYKQVGPIKK
ncbi:MAG: hypothetical protein KGJ09_01150 [Candidatus Omnitrophica bacterium]|nr:hypothetical protein [Candidatus Omnitrophota bacterium]